MPQGHQRNTARLLRRTTMPEKPDPKDPSNISSAYQAMSPRWEILNAVLGGTESMRAAGAKYLPKHEAEKDQDWQARRDATTLYNGLEMILDSLSSKPFAEPIQLQDDVPEKIKEMCEDIDLQGNNLDVFAYNWFREGVGKGFCHILVDFPRVDKVKPDGQPRTAADDLQENLRPYCCRVCPENVIAATYEVVNGVETLTQVRIVEAVVEQDGFLEVHKTQIRVLEIGKVTIYEKKEVNGKVTWVQLDQYETSLDFIPFITFYAEREDFMVAKPPLMDIAYLNITHWQSTSDQRNILTVGRFPMLAVNGMSDEEAKIVVGPRQFLRTSEPQGKFYYVEPTGAAISAGREDLLDLEEKMFSQGTEFLKEKPGGQTATARALDSAEAISPLQVMALSFKDSVELALDYMAKWLKLETGGSVKITTEFGANESTQQDLTTLDNARGRKDISRKAYLEELQRRGIVNEEFDAEEDQAQLEEEALTLNGGAGFDLDPNAGDPTNPDDPNYDPTKDPEHASYIDQNDTPPKKPAKGAKGAKKPPVKPKE
jgi:hypothetical protein